MPESIRAHCVDLIVLLIQASRGVRQATEAAPWPESRRSHEGSQTGDSEGPNRRGEVTDFTDRDSRQE